MKKGDDRDSRDEDSPAVEVTLKVMEHMKDHFPGRGTGCMAGPLLALVKRGFNSPGTFSVSSGPVTVKEPGTYSVGLCVGEIENATLRTRPFKPTGRPVDTGIYGIAFKDYKITAQAEGAAVTAHGRRMPGPTQRLAATGRMKTSVGSPTE